MIETTSLPHDVLVPTRYVSPDEAHLIDSSASYVEMRHQIMDEDQIRLHGLSAQNVAYGTSGQPESAMIVMDAKHTVTRGDATTEESIPGIVEVRFEDEVRRALLVSGEGGKLYTITRRSDAVYDEGPITLDDAAYGVALNIAKRTARSKTASPVELSPEARLRTSPGGSTNQVSMETTLLNAESDLSKRDITLMRLQLRAKGLSLTAVDTVAAQTSDMATFAQMAEVMTPEELNRALELRSEREAIKPTIPDEVPKEFVRYANSAQELTGAQMDVLRHAPAMRKLYTKLAAAGYDQVDVEWTFMPKIKGQDAFLFASVNGYRRRGTDKRVMSPMFIRGDAVAGLVQLGEDITTVRQARIATGSNQYEEAIAGMLADSDPLNNVKAALKTRLKAETHEETGIPEEAVEGCRYTRAISGLYPSTHSTEEILLGVLTGAALPDPVRIKLLASMNGLAEEHEAVRLSLTQQVGDILTRTTDLKTRLLALLLKRDQQQ